MPETVMTQTGSVVTCATDVTNHIQALIECMDNVEHVPEGFSDTSDSFEVNDSDRLQNSTHNEYKTILESDKILSKSLSLKNGILERPVPRGLYKCKFKQSENIGDHFRTTKSAGYKRSNTENNVDENQNDTSSAEYSNETTQTYYIGDNHNVTHKHEHHHNRNHHHKHHSHNNVEQSQHQHSHHRSNSDIHPINESSNDINADRVSSEKGSGDNVAEMFDVDSLAPITAGQADADVDVPIMSPPPPTEDRLHSSRSTSSFYSRPLSLRLLLSGDPVDCTFNMDTVLTSTKALISNAMREDTRSCFCSFSNSSQDTLSGWETNRKPGKPTKRRRNARQSDNTAFSRLTQHTAKDPVVFHHYKDTMKYIERYRFYHTVHNVGRPITYSTYEDKVPVTDPYYSKMKSNITSAMNAQLYDLASQVNEDKVGSGSSIESTHERSRSDDESNESSSVDAKTCSMRDRGKTLNLAPVRECTVPNLTQSETMNMFKLNQYLNLSTPPMSSDCLDFDIDDVRAKRYGYRLANDNNIFATSGVRRRSMPLRLGSAEFVKPGTSESANSKWSCEKRPTPKTTTNVLSTVPGNLIVGSTVSPLPAQPTRTRSGGYVPPYTQFQRDNSIHLPPSPLHEVSGQKVKTSDRLETPASGSGKDRGKFGYTHAEASENMASQIRTATAVDFRETYIPRDRSRTITLDMNNLGIRGQTLKQSEQMALYKNRRTQFVKS